MCGRCDNLPFHVADLAFPTLRGTATSQHMSPTPSSIILPLTLQTLTKSYGHVHYIYYHYYLVSLQRHSTFLVIFISFHTTKFLQTAGRKAYTLEYEAHRFIHNQHPGMTTDKKEYDIRYGSCVTRLQSIWNQTLENAVLVPQTPL